MREGWIRVCAITPQTRPADVEFNCARILEYLAQDEVNWADLAVFPELCLTGYTAGDLFLQDTLLAAAKKALGEIVRATEGKKILTVVGLPYNSRGKTYNCAALVQNGRLLGLVPKTHVPNYGEFYELRHFCPAPGEGWEEDVFGQMVPFGTNTLFCCENLPQFVLAVEICEDLWALNPPSNKALAAGATVVANLSASDETVGKAGYRRELVKGQSAKGVCGYVYADAGTGESSTDMVFAGHNLVCEDGVLLAESKPFGKGAVFADIDLSRIAAERRRMNTFAPGPQSGWNRVSFELAQDEPVITREISPHPFLPAGESDRAKRCEEILSIQAAGLATRLRHINAEKVVVGVSGGLDSTLALLVCARAFDELGLARSGILGVTMPCFGTTGRTYQNAVKLIKTLGASFLEVDIQKSVQAHFADIGQDEGVHDVTYENAQARERTQVLMDIGNKNGAIVVGTGDLSELALGWATYNGDHMSMYGVNAGVPKTLVRHLVDYAAHLAQDELAAALADVLDTPVSPELLPPENGKISQKTEDLVGPYELHDFFLYYFMRYGFSPKKIFSLAVMAFGESYDKKTILKWEKTFFRRFFAQQFKRSCLPDGPKVGSVSLSPRGDWRMPSDASAKAWLDELSEL